MLEVPEEIAMNPSRPFAGKPQADEYSSYHVGYISQVESPDIVAVLREQGEKTLAGLRQLSEADGEFRYAPGKWSVKEMVGHINDAERVFTYRGLRLARNDRTPLPPFEQDDYVRWGRSGERRLEDLIEEFSDIRKATIWLFEALNAEEWNRRGIVNGNEISVRALAYITAGHELHHRKILGEKYFPARMSA
jgi:hypothetical protein